MILENEKQKRKEKLIWLIRISISLFWIGFFIGVTFFLLWLRCGSKLLVVWECREREDIYFLVTNLITSFSFSVTSALTYQKIKTFFRLRKENNKFAREKRKRLKSK